MWPSRPRKGLSMPREQRMREQQITRCHNDAANHDGKAHSARRNKVGGYTKRYANNCLEMNKGFLKTLNVL